MYDRRNHAKRLLFGGIVLGHFAALWLALVEGAFLALAAGGARLAGASAPRMIFYDALVLLLLGPVMGLVAGAVVSGVHLLATSLAPQRQQEPMWKARAYVALAIPWAAWVAQQAFTGPRARALPYRSLLALGTGLTLLGGVWVASRIGSHVAGRLAAGHASRATRLLVPPGLLAASVGLYAADALVLPRLYPFFHWSLGAAALLTAWLGVGAAHLGFGRALRRRFGRLARPAWAAGAAMALLLLGFLGQRQVGRSNRLRGLLFERTSGAAKVLTLASRLGAMPAPEPLRATLPKDHPRRVRSASLRAHPGALRGADVMLITVDALRADRIGLLGYRRRVGESKPVSITPNIDRIFGTGLIYRRAYTVTPRTSYAVVSLLTGVPIHALLNLGVQRRWPTLPEVLTRRGGYRTAGFYPKAVFTIDRARFRRYELEHLGFQFFHFEGHDMPAAKRTDQVLAYLDGPGRQARPLFLWAHYFDPHEPYRVQPGYEAFGRRARDRYDAEVAYADAQIGRLVDGVRRRRPGRVIWVLAADHGEEFGEHGGTNHGTTLYDEQARVPLLIVGPGIPSRAVDAPVSLLEVPGALARLVGLSAPPPMGDAPPLDLEAEGGRDLRAAAFADLDEQRMVVQGHHKLIQNRSRGYLALYDLKADPKEAHPLDIDRPGAARKRASRLLGHLERWRRRLERLRRSSERAGSGALRLALVSSNLARRRAAARSLLRQALAEWLRSEGAPAAATQPGSGPSLRPARAGGLSSPPLLRALKTHLRDPDPEVRHCALATLSLRRLAPASSHGALLTLSRRWDLPTDLALAAGVVLARRGQPSATALLAPLLGRLHSVDARAAVVRLLGDPGIASAEGIAALRLALTDWELNLDSLRAIAHLARAPTPVTRALARQALPGVVAVLRASAEHLGHRAQALRTLAAIGTPAARSLMAEWVRSEPAPELRALGLALLVQRPAGPPSKAPSQPDPGSPWLLRLPSPLVEAPSGACLPSAGCRLEPTPTAITWPVTFVAAGTEAALFLVTDAPPRRAPEITLEGERLTASPEPVFGADVSPLGLAVWRVALPAAVRGRVAEHRVARISLWDATGQGVVVRGLAWITPPPATTASAAPRPNAPREPPRGTPRQAARPTRPGGSRP